MKEERINVESCRVSAELFLHFETETPPPPTDTMHALANFVKVINQVFETKLKVIPTTGPLLKVS